MKRVVLNRKISNRVVSGHPWIFSNEINKLDDSIVAGDIAEVYTHDAKFVGKGYVNPASMISIRLLTRDKKDTIDKAFFRNKIAAAWDYRKKIGYTENCRLVYGEADGIPQLIIDKFKGFMKEMMFPLES